MSPSLVLGFIGAVGVLGASAQAAWWLMLSCLALKRPDGPPIQRGRESVAVVIPAHNETLLVGRTVQSIAESGRKHDGQVRICVVADNCSDDTVAVALMAGAFVYERKDLNRRGKSYALEFGLRRIRRWQVPPDVVIFVDADSNVSPEFVAACVDRIRRGAGAVQVHYEAAAGSETVRRVRRLAFALVHWSRPLGAARLGLGTSLKGNGMAFPWSTVEEGIAGTGVAEDAAMSLTLARRGIRVEFEPRASVKGHMARDWTSAATQDMRWEYGRLALCGRGIGTLVRAVRAHPSACNGALEAISPSLTIVALVACVGGVAWTVAGGFPLFGFAGMGLLCLYVTTGWAAARVDPGDLVACLSLPRFVLFKLNLFARLPWKRLDWITTQRD